MTFDVVDFGLCSPNLLFKFINYLQDEYKLGHGGRLGYIDAISEMIDFRKLHGASEAIFKSSLQQSCTSKERERLLQR